MEYRLYHPCQNILCFWHLYGLVFDLKTIGISSLDHDLMDNIWEDAISILAGNLNSGCSYLTTTVTIAVALQIPKRGCRRWNKQKVKNIAMEVWIFSLLKTFQHMYLVASMYRVFCWNLFSELTLADRNMLDRICTI